MSRSLKVLTTLAVVLLCFAFTAFSQVAKDPGSTLDTFAFRDFNLGVKSYPVQYQMVKDKLPNADAWKAFNWINSQLPNGGKLPAGHKWAFEIPEEKEKE